MKTRIFASLLLGTAVGLVGDRLCQRPGQDRQDRRAVRPIRPLCRSRRPRFDARRPDGDRGFRPDRQGLEDRHHLRRSPEQAGYRHRTSRGSGSMSKRSTSSSTFRIPAWRSQSTTSSRKRTASYINSGAAIFGPHQRAVLAQYRALDLRHLHAGPRHRPGTGEERAAIPGSSSPPIMPSARRSSATPRPWSWPTGGKVLGGVKHPLNTADFSSFLLQAQASKAKIIGLANAGGDTTNTIKQAAEFGIVRGGQKLAALLLFITDVKAIGLETAQGLNFTETFYWDMNDKTREILQEDSLERMKNNAPPTMVQAGVYAGLLHYFKALDALGGNPHDGVKVVDKMKSMPTDDPCSARARSSPTAAPSIRPICSRSRSRRNRRHRGITTSWSARFRPTGIHAACRKQVRAPEEVGCFDVSVGFADWPPDDQRSMS